VNTARPQKKRATKEHLGKRSGERNMWTAGFRYSLCELEKDGGGSTGQSWMETEKWWTAGLCYLSSNGNDKASR